MRLDKTVARVLLIYSIASVVLAAPTVVRQRHLITDRADDKPTDESEQVQGLLAELEHQSEVLPAAPPSVGLPDGKDSEVSLSDSMESILDWLESFRDPPSPPLSPLHPSYLHYEPPSDLLHQDLGESPSHMESGALGGGGGLAPASGAQPLHDLNPATDIEQAATRLDSWGSSSVDDMHFHRSFE